MAVAEKPINNTVPAPDFGRILNGLAQDQNGEFKDHNTTIKSSQELISKLEKLKETNPDLKWSVGGTKDGSAIQIETNIKVEDGKALKITVDGQDVKLSKGLPIIEYQEQKLYVSKQKLNANPDEEIKSVSSTRKAANYLDKLVEEQGIGSKGIKATVKQPETEIPHAATKSPEAHAPKAQVPESPAPKVQTPVAVEPHSTHKSAPVTGKATTAMGGAGVVIGGAGIIEKLNGETYKNDVKAGGAREALAKTTVVADGAAVASGAAGMAESVMANAPKVLGQAGKASLPIAVGVGVAEGLAGAMAEDGHRASEAVGGTAGALAGAKAGAKAGITASPPEPRLKAILGTAGALIGGVVGYFGGAKATDALVGDKAHEILNPPTNKVETPKKELANLSDKEKLIASMVGKEMANLGITTSNDNKVVSQHISSKPEVAVGHGGRS